jgi:hypothetical protein
MKRADCACSFLPLIPEGVRGWGARGVRVSSTNAVDAAETSVERSNSFNSAWSYRDKIWRDRNKSCKFRSCTSLKKYRMR